MTAAISCEQIFIVANELAKSGKMPTVVKVRIGLGHKGSASTIHKYLNEWKFRLLQNAALIDHKDVSYKQENLILHDNLAKLQASLQAITLELSELEARELLLINEKQQLLQTKMLLEAQVAGLNKQVDSLSTVLAELKSEREATIAAIVSDKNQHIARLEDELKKLQASYLDSIREQSTKAHDSLMDEKVKIINLQHELARIKKELVSYERGKYV